MNKISIALGSYNGARFLPEQLASFAAQTVLPDELIVSDDCSTDRTAEIVREFARTAPFAVEFYGNEKNLGSTLNFEKTIELCSGDLIFLSDQDDVWLPSKIEKIRHEFERDGRLGLVFTDAELVDENLAPLGVKLCDLTFHPSHRHIETRRQMLELLLPRNYATGATMAFRRDLRESFLPFPIGIPEMIHDAWIAFVAVAESDFKFLDEPLIKYRQHGGQQLGLIFPGAANGGKFEQMATALKLLRGEAKRIEKIRDCFQTNPRLSVAADLVGELAERKLTQTAERIRHLEARTNLPTGKPQRLASVWREIKSGRYHKFSKGYLSALKDVAARY